MLHKYAIRIAASLASRNAIDKDRCEVYAYGFELILSALINILLIAIVSIIFRRYYDWLLFLVAFIPLRTTAGGYHASSHIKCILTGTIVFAVLLAVSLLNIQWLYIIPIIAVFSLIMIILFSPVEPNNKKLKENQNKQNRRHSICLGVINIVLAAFAIVYDGLSNIFSIYYLGVFAATLSLLVVKANKAERSGEHETREELAL